jgi:colanic acid biosynthesis glycosyl transferase WcaI
VKILLYGINFAPELTGVGKFTGEMAEWLAARGHEVRVVTGHPYYPGWRVHPGYRANRYRTESWNGVRVWRCPLWVPSRPGGIKRILHLASFATFSLAAIGRQVMWRPDVVWVVEPTLLCAPTAWLGARLCGASAWLHIQDFEIDVAFELGILRGDAVRRLAAAFERLLLRRFDRVSTISERMLARARTKGVDASRLVSFPNWADSACFAEAKVSNPVREELGIGSNQMVALYSGTMGRKQGLELLAAAAARLGDSTNVVFVLCGDGPGRDELIAQCDGLPNVRFLGLQPPERLGSLLAAADIHVLPQQADAADLVMPSKLPGMLASGRPVVATCASGTEIAEVIRDCGIAVTPGDVDGLAEAIRRLAHDQDLRCRLGAHGRTYAREHFSRDTIMEAYERAMSEAVGRK